MAVAAPRKSETEGTVGHVIAITGPVVDIEFPPGQLPAIYNAVEIAARGRSRSSARCSSTSATTGCAPSP